MEIITKDPSVGRLEIAKLMGDITEDGVKYHLEKLKSKGTIKRIGGDKGGYWEINKKA